MKETMLKSIKRLLAAGLVFALTLSMSPSYAEGAAVKSETKRKYSTSDTVTAVKSDVKSKQVSEEEEEFLDEVGDGSTYRVSFKKNSDSVIGNQMSQQTFTFGEKKALKPCAYSREGYEYIEWNTESDGSGLAIGDEEEIVFMTASANVFKGDTLELWAQWQPMTYVVEYDSNSGGTAVGKMKSQGLTYDQEASLYENQYKREGYNFVSWNTKSDGTGTTYKDKSSVKNLSTGSKVTLYAQWQMAEVSYTVKHWQQNVYKKGTTEISNAASHDDTNYTLVETVTATVKDSSQVTPPVKEYAGFTSPTPQTLTLSTDSSKNVMNYYYTRKTYTITYKNPDTTNITNSSGGTWNVPAPVTALYGQSVTAAINDAKKKKDSDKYTITYHGNGGTVGSSSSSTYTESKSLTIEYEAAGWEQEGTSTTSSLMKLLGMTELQSVGGQTWPSGGTVSCNGNMTLVPYFTISKESGSTKVSFPTAVRSGYNFQGWYTTSSGGTYVGTKGTSYDILEDEKDTAGDVYAHWTYDSTSSTSSTGTSNSNRSSSYATTAAGTAAAAGAAGAVADAAVSAKKSTTKTKAAGEPEKDEVPPTGEDASKAADDEVIEAFLDLVDTVF